MVSHSVPFFGEWDSSAKSFKVLIYRIFFILFKEMIEVR
ncbi:hypothetical protein ABIB39_004310 [Mucilaginibacter sp. UYP27]